MRFATLSLALALNALPAAAHAQSTLPLPRPIHAEELDALGDAVRHALVPVRTREDLGENYRPRWMEADGVAVWLALPEPTLVTTWVHVARASEVSVWIDGAWREARPHHGGPMFDLVALDVDGVEPPAPLELATEWPIGGTWSMAPVVPEQEATVVVAAFGERPEDDYAYYVRSLLPYTNGYPIFDDDGAVVALCSLGASDRPGGVLAVPLAYIRVWRDEWPQLVDSPIGWEPRVRYERGNLTTGREALEGER